MKIYKLNHRWHEQEPEAWEHKYYILYRTKDRPFVIHEGMRYVTLISFESISMTNELIEL